MPDEETVGSSTGESVVVLGESIVFVPEKEYEELTEDRIFLDMLEDLGVSKWKGYQIALDLTRGDVLHEDVRSLTPTLEGNK